MQIVPQAVPLPEEQELQIDEQLHVLAQERAVLLEHGGGPAQAELLVVPLRPRAHAEMALAGHEERVVREPARVFAFEGGDGLAVALPSARLGAREHGKAALVNFPVVDVSGIVSPVGSGDFTGGQQAVRSQLVEVNEVGIAGVGGKALVRGVSVACRPEGQHLPVALARCVQKIGKVIGGPAERADPVRGREGIHRHQDAAASFHSKHHLLSEILENGVSGLSP